jgi:hypothetical protein
MDIGPCKSNPEVNLSFYPAPIGTVYFNVLLPNKYFTNWRNFPISVDGDFSFRTRQYSKQTLTLTTFRDARPFQIPSKLHSNHLTDSSHDFAASSLTACILLRLAFSATSIRHAACTNCPGAVSMHSIWSEDAMYLELKSRASSYRYNQRIGELDFPAHVIRFPL